MNAFQVCRSSFGIDHAVAGRGNVAHGVSPYVGCPLAPRLGAIDRNGKGDDVFGAQGLRKRGRQASGRPKINAFATNKLIMLVGRG